ncbi:MAG: multidrug efflux SMR transporter [Elioraea sp.]|nr:multidrug efflux SMR transporter [Elioraea sp.]
MAKLLLALAILSEVLATSALKASEGFSRPGFALAALAGYGLSFWALAMVLKTIPVGVAYAIWSGVGIVGITLVGRFAFGQVLDAAALVGIGLIVAGVLMITLFSRAMG